VADIAIGLVFHAVDAVHGLGSDPGIEILTHVNASPAHGTAWRGFAANHNDLMSQTEARWYVALNPDVAVDAQDLERLVTIAEEADLAIAGPAIASPWGTSTEGKQGFPGPRAWMQETVVGTVRRERSSRGPGGVQRSDWLTGACLAIRRDLGLRFDPRYFMYFEDADLCRRAWQHGFKVGMCSSVVATHASGWSPDDALVRRRGVEFARSALHFAESAGVPAGAMTVAGIARFGSRVVLRRSRASQRAAAKSIVRGFARPSLPGLSELAVEFNASQGRPTRVGARDAVG
jgi:N-acetylglucosaminyl-diphospho-decaprenol L-rhamnosyltransferase